MNPVTRRRGVSVVGAFHVAPAPRLKVHPSQVLEPLLPGEPFFRHAVVVGKLFVGEGHLWVDVGRGLPLDDFIDGKTSLSLISKRGAMVISFEWVGAVAGLTQH